MIRLYPSKMEGEPLETYKIKEVESVLSFIERKAETKVKLDQPQPVTVFIDGVPITTQSWPEALIMPGQKVDIVFEAKGGVVDSITGILSSVINSVVGLFIRTPSTGSVDTDSGQRRETEDIDLATIKANQPKLNDPIPERFGLNRVYPDFVVPNHKYFIGSEQYTDIFLSVGYGQYSVDGSQINIGNTPIPALGSDASYQVFMPGDNVSVNPASQFWFSSEEVGSTASGEGLLLGVTTTVATNPNAVTYTFNGTTITIPNGAGSFPAWEAGMYVHLERYTPVTFGGFGTANYIEGEINNYPVQAGDILRIRGSGVNTDVSVDSVQASPYRIYLATTGGDPISFIEDGEYNVSISYGTNLYLITGADSQNITVSLLDNNLDPVSNWLGFDTRQTVSASLNLDQSTVEGGWTGPYLACPDNEVTDRIEYDLFFPQGLVEFDDSDAEVTYSKSFRYEVQYRDASVLGNWTSITNTISKNSKDQYGETFSATLPYAMNPQVRIRRLGAESESAFIQDRCQWYGLRSRLDAPSSYPDVTTMAIRLRTGTRLASQTDNKVWCYCTRNLPPYDSPQGSLRSTRSIADAVAYIARKVGYTDAQLDLDRLGELQDTWTARGDFFDHSFLNEQTVKKAINTALNVGFSELTVERGRITPVRDELRTTFDHAYTPQNMTSEVRQSITMRSLDLTNDYDGVDVQYFSLETGEKETVKCRLPGDAGTKVKKVTVDGINDRTRAWRYGMRQRRAMKYQRKSYSFTTGFDSLNSSYLDYCAVTDNIERYGQSAEVVSYESDGQGNIVIQTTQPFTETDGSNHVAILRRPDGTASGPYTASLSDDGDLVIPLPDFDPIDLTQSLTDGLDSTHIAFGVESRAFYPVLVTEVSPNGSPMDDEEPSVSVSAIIYDPRVYADDDNYPNEED